MNCELCGGPGPAKEFGLADGDIALCSTCFKKSEAGSGPEFCWLITEWFDAVFQINGAFSSKEKAEMEKARLEALGVEHGVYQIDRQEIC